MSDLLESYKLGDLTLKNRMVMAPMTRSRAVDDSAPHPLAPLYYSQRASAGLIISEGTVISPMGRGFIRTPGIYNDVQIEGWKNVTDAVHSKGGLIFMQLWHVGRFSHTDFHNGRLPVAPSAVSADAVSYTFSGLKKIPTPRALATIEVKNIVQEFKIAAENAKLAGFDGVEIHGSNGFLLEQFLKTSSNLRDDEYGSTLEGRVRFPLEVANAVCEVFGEKRVGYKMSPFFSFRSMKDEDPNETYGYFVEKLSDMGLGYVHVCEEEGMEVPPGMSLIPLVREKFRGTYIVGGGLNKEKAEHIVDEKVADLVAFGKLFISNPDLPERFRQNAELNQPNKATFYTGEGKGYTDYPSL